MNESRDKDRVKWIDELKGIAIFMVVIGHVADMFYDRGTYMDYMGIMSFISNIGNTFMMPLFFVISGCSFGIAYIKDDGQGTSLGIVKKDRIIQQILNLTILYIMWSVIFCILKIIFSADVIDQISYKDILWIPFKAISLYWYLYVLIFCYIFTLFFLIKKIRIKHLMITGIISCMLQYWITYGKIEEWTITKVSMYFFFFIFGILLVKMKGKIKIIQDQRIIVFSLCMGVTMMFLSWIVLFRNSIDSRFVWSDIPILGGGYAGLICIGIIGGVIRKQEKFQCFSFIGKYCLEIYLLHRFVMMGIRVLFSYIEWNDFYLNYFVEVIISICIPVVISLLLKKIKLYNLLFKPIVYFSRNGTVNA